MGEWKEYKLGDLAKVKGGKRLPLGKNLTEQPTRHPYIRTRDINNNKIAISDLLYVPEDVFNSISRYIVEKDDVIISIVGTIGLCAIVPSELHLASLTENCAKIVDINKNKLDSKFLFYFFTSDIGQEEIGKRNVGSTQPKLPLYNINDIPIPTPPLNEQQTIASILSSLDDKIDLLHRQNKTLEALAETLFRQWFVEEADESWEEKSLYDLMEIIGGGTPKTEISEYWDGEINWMSGKDITANHKQFILTTEKNISMTGLKNSSAKVLPKFASVVSARGTVGKICLLSRPMAFSQTNYGILPKIKDCFFFSYLLLSYSVEELQSAAYGCVFDTITTNTFKEHKISIPKESEILKLEAKVSSLFYKMFSNENQIRTLTQLRDTLLPKLMSGEIRLNCDLCD